MPDSGKLALRFGLMTVSDRSAAGVRPDASGPILSELVTQMGWVVAEEAVVPDEEAEIARLLAAWADRGDLDVILTTGGTGFSLRDRTPEATLRVVERLAPGIAEAMRAASLAVTPHGMLSRGVSGIRKRSLIINLPGSPKGARENLEVVLPVLAHAAALLGGDPDAEAGHARPGALPDGDQP